MLNAKVLQFVSTLNVGHDVLNVMVVLFALIRNLKADVQNVAGLVYVFIRNVKSIVLNVLKVNVYVSIKNEKADARIVKVQRYARMVNINIIV